MLRSIFKLTGPIVVLIISASALALSAQAQEKEKTSSRQDATQRSILMPQSSKEQDGLIGPVRRVRTERAELSMKFGKLVEGPRSLLSTTTYNVQGNSVDNTYYLVNEKNRAVRKEEYKYDQKGNVIEATLRNNHGAIVSREVFTYEFDEIGNWKKMVTSLVIYEGGKLSLEPIEITYRNISYYFSDTIATNEKFTPSQKGTSTVSAPDTARDGNSKRRAKANEPAVRSDDNRKNRSLNPEGSKVNSGPSTDRTSAGARATGNPEMEDPLIIKPNADPSESRTPKPQARLFSDGDNHNQVVMVPSAAYPDEAKSARITGTVVVIVEIDAEGKVISARADSGPPALRTAAVEAALKARFSPTGLKSQRSKRSSVISFTFSLIE